MQPDAPFGALLRRYRIAASLTQEALAERAGLSVRGISDLGRGVNTQPRLETVRTLAQRLGITIIETRLIQAEDDVSLPAGPFDGALVDVPCSNTGVLGRRPEVRWRLKPQDVPRLVARPFAPVGRPPT